MKLSIRERHMRRKRNIATRSMAEWLERYWRAREAHLDDMLMRWRKIGWPG